MTAGRAERLFENQCATDRGDDDGQRGGRELVGVYSGRTHKDSDLGFVWRIDEVDVICTDGVAGTT